MLFIVTVAAQSSIHRQTDLQILTASAAVVQQYRSAVSPSSRDQFSVTCWKSKPVSSAARVLLEGRMAAGGGPCIPLASRILISRGKELPELEFLRVSWRKVGYLGIYFPP